MLKRFYLNCLTDFDQCQQIYSFVLHRLSLQLLYFELEIVDHLIKVHT